MRSWMNEENPFIVACQRNDLKSLRSWGPWMHSLVSLLKNWWREKRELSKKSVAGKDGLWWSRWTRQGNLWGGGEASDEGGDEGEEGSRGRGRGQLALARRERRQSPALGAPLQCKASEVVAVQCASGRWGEAVGPGSSLPPPSAVSQV